jgi:hypothetical protein
MQKKYLLFWWEAVAEVDLEIHPPQAAEEVEEAEEAQSLFLQTFQA